MTPLLLCTNNHTDYALTSIVYGGDAADQTLPPHAHENVLLRAACV